MVALSGLAPEYCENADPVYLTGTPAGGSFSGRGMVVNVFDPELAGLGGPFPVLYTYNDPSGCTATDSQWVTINPLPKPNLDRVDFSYCLEGQPVELPAVYKRTDVRVVPVFTDNTARTAGKNRQFFLERFAVGVFDAIRAFTKF